MNLTRIPRLDLESAECILELSRQLQKLLEDGLHEAGTVTSIQNEFLQWSAVVT